MPDEERVSTWSPALSAVLFSSAYPKPPRTMFTLPDFSHVVSVVEVLEPAPEDAVFVFESPLKSSTSITPAITIATAAHAIIALNIRFFVFTFAISAPFP